MKQVGRYELRRELARGGQGAVWAAWDPVGGREVALKLLHGLRIKPEAAERFRIEAEALAALQHPNVVAVHDFGEADGSPYLVMDLVSGSSLQARLEREGPLPVDEAVSITRAVAEALAHAHAQGVIHRDLKPHNVLLAADGRPLLTDFGLAARIEDEPERLTRTGEMLGTPSTMAPEQVDGKQAPLDVRTDVYGLGALLYALLVGTPPFTGGPVQVMAAVLTRPPPAPSAARPEIDPRLDAICARCLAKRPAGRYPTAAALVEALNDYASHESAPPRSRLPGLLALAAALAVLALLVVALVVVPGVVGSGEVEPAAAPPSATATATSTPRRIPPPTATPSPPDRFRPASFSVRGEGLVDRADPGLYSSHRGLYVHFLDARHLVAVPLRGASLWLFTDQIENRRSISVRIHEFFSSAVTTAGAEPLLALGGPRPIAGKGRRKAGEIVLFALRDGGLIEVGRTTIPGPPEVLAFSPDGALIAFGLRFLSLGVRRIDDLQRDLGTVQHPGKSTKSTMVRALTFSANGQELASGSAAAENADYSVMRWKVSGTTLERGATVKLGLDAVQRIVPLPQGGYLVGTRNWRLRVLTGGAFGGDFVRNPDSFKSSVHSGHRIRDVQLRGADVFTATWVGGDRAKGELRRWRRRDRRFLRSLPLRAPSRPFSLALSPDGKRLAVGHSGPESKLLPRDDNDLGRVDVLAID